MNKPSMLWIAAVALLIGLLSGAYGTGQADKQGEALLQAAKNMELVKGDLNAAIEQYKKILARPGAGRTVAAKALLEMGQCYEKLGQAEARSAYEQLVRQYADQSEQVQAARARLAALGGAPTRIAGTEMTIRKVWSGPDVDVSGSPSPDGRYISHMDLESGDLAIWEIASGQKRRLTNTGGWTSKEFVLSSKWSPDGKRIAYAWSGKTGNTELRIIGSNGSEPRVLAAAWLLAWPLDWSPDARSILAIVIEKQGNPGKLALISLANGSLTALGTAEKPISTWNAGFSADGKYVVYSIPQQEKSQERDIFIIPVDGKQGIPLVRHPAHDELLGWVPASDTVLFASDRAGSRDAWAIHVTDGRSQGEPVLVKQDIGQVSAMGFTDRGSLCYSLGGSVMNVFEGSLDLARGTLVQPPKKIGQSVVGSIYNVEWSPDAKYLAYVSERRTSSSSQSSFVLSIRSDQTGEVREIPLPVNGFRYVHWSADSRAVFATMRDKANYELYKIDIQSGKLTLIVPSGPDSNITNFAVSPDGKALYYALLQPKTPLSLIRRDLETGQEKEIYQGRDGDAVGLTISPDGKYASFGGVRVVPTAGGEPRDLLRGTLENNARVMRHAWTPDGKTILFVKISASGSKVETRELWQIPSAGGEPRKINMGPPIVQVHLHPGGQRIAFTSGAFSNEVWVMENFLPALKVAR